MFKEAVLMVLLAIRAHQFGVGEDVVVHLGAELVGSGPGREVERSVECVEFEEITVGSTRRGAQASITRVFPAVLTVFAAVRAIGPFGKVFG